MIYDTRPNGSKKMTGGRPKKSKGKAKRIAKACKANRRHQPELRRLERQFSEKKSENPDFWKELPKPTRNGHVLSQDQIDAAIRMIYTLKEKNTKVVFNLVSEGLDIHVSTHYKIRGNFIKEGKVPCLFKGRTRAVRIKFVAMEWFEPMRIEAERIRLIEKRIVELLDIQQ